MDRSTAMTAAGALVLTIAAAVGVVAIATDSTAPAAATEVVTEYVYTDGSATGSLEPVVVTIGGEATTAGDPAATGTEAPGEYPGGEYDEEEYDEEEEYGEDEEYEEEEYEEEEYEEEEYEEEDEDEEYEEEEEHGDGGSEDDD